MTAETSVLLSPLCAAAAAGRTGELAALARSAVDGGCAAATVREALLTLVPYCGFPRALDAFAAVAPVIGAAPPPEFGDPASLAARGGAFFGLVYGRDADRVRANVGALDASVASWVETDAYGKVLSRPGIPASLRERIGVVLLAAQGLRTQLSGHVRGALNCGATAAEIATFLDAAAPFIATQELAFARETLRRVAG